MMQAEHIKDYVNLRLIHWASWHNQASKIRLGYPTRSIEWRILHEGIVNQRQHGADWGETDAAAEEIDQMIQEMQRQSPLMASVLRAEYSINDEGQGQREKAMQLKMSHSYYCALLERAMQWLAGCLTSKVKLFK